MIVGPDPPATYNSRPLKTSPWGTNRDAANTEAIPIPALARRTTSLFHPGHIDAARPITATATRTTIPGLGPKGCEKVGDRFKSDTGKSHPFSTWEPLTGPQASQEPNANTTTARLRPNITEPWARAEIKR